MRSWAAFPVLRAAGIDMTSGVWASAGTFRQCLTEKAAFILLNQADLALTLLAVSLGLSELNPFVKQLLAMPVLLLMLKLAVPLLIAWLAPGRFLLPAIVLLCLVVGWNVKELLVFLL